jgi:hypothetical protein
MPGQAGNPNPADGAIAVSIDQDLSWTPGSGAASHDVYFGTSIILPFIKNLTAATFDPGRMDLDKKYYWRINEKTTSGTIAGPLWSFTTSKIPPPPPLVGRVVLLYNTQLKEFSLLLYAIVGRFFSRKPP